MCKSLSVYVPCSLDAGSGRGVIDPIPSSGGASTLAEETGVQTVPVVPAGTGTIITEPGVQFVPVIPERPAITMDPSIQTGSGPAPIQRTFTPAPVTPPVTPPATAMFNPAPTMPASLPFVPDASQVIDPAAPMVPITPGLPTTRVTAPPPMMRDVGPPFQVTTAHP